MMTWSQFGEDDIISELLNRPHGIITDIGAGDGMEISNSRLFREAGWDTVLIEADIRYAEVLQKLASERCYVWLEEVTPENINEYVHPRTDVLSIDVDGDDIFLLEALAHRPEIIVIEHNPTIPYDADVQPAGLGLRVGSSVAALRRVAKEKGYGLAAVTHCNAIFQRGIPGIDIPFYDPLYAVGTEYFTGRPFIIGTAPWGVYFGEPYPLENIIVR